MSFDVNPRLRFPVKLHRRVVLVVTEDAVLAEELLARKRLAQEVAGRLSDLIVVTSDNPRSEDPRAIIDEILPGTAGLAATVEVESDRAKAIILAMTKARAGDIVVIAGKGHEKTQTIGKQVLPFDDVAVAREALAWVKGRS